MNQATLEKMKHLKLYGMHRAFSTTMETGSISYTNDELIAYLIESEYDDRESRKVERLITSARFRYRAFMEEITASSSRNIDKNTIGRLSSCDFISQKQNILITGSTGVGKSFIATAIGYKACTMGYKVMYFSINKLFSKLKMAKADGSYLKEIDRIEKQDLIILDDFGLQSLDNLKRQDFMEIIEDRHGKRSTIIASQLPVSVWHEVIAEQTIADAILDRMVHNSLRIDLKGESMRRKKADQKISSE
ncbi:IS21-like element helper ATPase IstB [Chryseobacterium camelliae]|uniref:IS21-like element helper ATPase IstB n=1 Tax=Chryseobacterium camelliae TaxID=1265445 RepID=A0ABY7QNS4_9FLAO|nr:IS21-like element helper ATPase IstB [Chryseobacterium camelliae]WBV58992.1 IS21-like element helper ATPase IstB [Chryseobacterium camelliae]WBV59925.1 IS21-like element helper ATPase IstB [Chryseobacterium camelliae]WBV60100.1 IS21-like element helper ATPase IstB [Chryseobacterium camelliae]WBV60215.1 IS21-like element helper ATPase IstB [Chryseobacterium camelliae]WBV60482.1 IS21-like element helper ATPase IstB [Chryseobacterium camelliae]